MGNPTVICVTGMGRCGTSLVARALNLLGVGLGPEDHLMGPAASNPRGHWEHEPLVNLNDEILAFFGGSWDEPPLFPLGWHRSPAIVELREKARVIVEADFAGVDLWAWKDPRSSVTMPFWQDLLPPMKYIICLRNPLDVAFSLLRRDRYTLEKSGRLWLTYVTSAIAHTSGHPRLFMFYEDLMDDWRGQVARMAALIERPGWAPDPLAMKSIGEFVDHELEHHRTTLAQSLSEAAISFPTQALYLMLRGTVTVTNPAIAGQRADEAGMDAAIEHFSRECLEAETGLGAPDGEMAELLNRLTEMTQIVSLQEEKLKALTADLVARLTEKGQAMATMADKGESLTRQLSEREKQVAGMEQSMSWRWTRPLRVLKGRLRSLVRR